MKKILFTVINMNIGGVEKALLNMLEEIPRDKYEVTVLMLEEYGGFLKDIPSWINVQILDYYKTIKKLVNDPPQFVAKDLCKEKKYIKAFNILLKYSICKITNDMSYYYKYVLKDYPIIDDNYDIAIAYHGPMDFISYVVINKIKAKKKYQWIHFDITTIHMNDKFVNKIYNKFDRIFVVSKDGKERFINKYPKLKNKTEVFLNTISSKLIELGSQQGIGFDDEFNGIRILTVGRLCREKGQDITIPILARLKDEGYKVKWYCIGEGGLRYKCEELIKKYNLKEDYILLGSKSNPYPYMKSCDIYVQPSVYEGYCISLAEARVLNKPIVTTDFTGAKEQLEHGQTGIIVKRNEEEIYNKIKELIDNEELRKKIIRNLKEKIVDTSKDINKLFT